MNNQTNESNTKPAFVMDWDKYNARTNEQKKLDFLGSCHFHHISPVVVAQLLHEAGLPHMPSSRVSAFFTGRDKFLADKAAEEAIKAAGTTTNLEQEAVTG